MDINIQPRMARQTLLLFPGFKTSKKFTDVEKQKITRLKTVLKYFIILY